MSEESTAVFGPVPSRRLGQSLGIDPIPPKTCNWNCVYCQLGRSVPVVNERRHYVPTQTIIAQVRDALDAHRAGDIDWITFVGSGEPTLHAGLGELIRAVKAMTPIPVAVITNGSLLYLPEVRGELLPADAVLPTLDAGEQALYRRINRPWASLTFDRLLQGLISFREEYPGKLWPEVMLVRGLNDSEQALRSIAAALRRVRPDEVHLNLPTRPPAETWVQPADAEGIMRAQAIIGDIARVVRPSSGRLDLSGYTDVVEAVVGIVTRHPMREDELIDALARWVPGEVEDALRRLESSGRIQVVERLGRRFWSVAGARYPEHSKPPRPLRRTS